MPQSLHLAPMLCTSWPTATAIASIRYSMLWPPTYIPSIYGHMSMWYTHMLWPPTYIPSMNPSTHTHAPSQLPYAGREKLRSHSHAWAGTCEVGIFDHVVLHVGHWILAITHQLGQVQAQLTIFLLWGRSGAALRDAVGWNVFGSLAHAICTESWSEDGRRVL